MSAVAFSAHSSACAEGDRTSQLQCLSHSRVLFGRGGRRLIFNSLILSSRRPLTPRCATSSNVSNIASFSMPRARMLEQGEDEVFGQPDERFAGILWILTRTVLKLISTRLGGEGMRRGEPGTRTLISTPFAARRHRGAPQSGESHVPRLNLTNSHLLTFSLPQGAGDAARCRVITTTRRSTSRTRKTRSTTSTRRRRSQLLARSPDRASCIFAPDEGRMKRTRKRTRTRTRTRTTRA